MTITDELRARLFLLRATEPPAPAVYDYVAVDLSTRRARSDRANGPQCQVPEDGPAPHTIHSGHFVGATAGAERPV